MYCAEGAVTDLFTLERENALNAGMGRPLNLEGILGRQGV